MFARAIKGLGDEERIGASLNVASLGNCKASELLSAFRGKSFCLLPSNDDSTADKKVCHGLGMNAESANTI